MKEEEDNNKIFFLLLKKSKNKIKVDTSSKVALWKRKRRNTSFYFHKNRRHINISNINSTMLVNYCTNIFLGEKKIDLDSRRSSNSQKPLPWSIIEFEEQPCSSKELLYDNFPICTWTVPFYRSKHIVAVNVLRIFNEDDISEVRRHER